MMRTKCPLCHGKLLPGHKIHDECIDPWAQAQQAKAERLVVKKQRAAEKLDRAQTRKRKQAIKTIPDLLKETRTACHAFIRKRDEGLPCISCNAPDCDKNIFHGGRDAGHYRSVGSAPHLRFNEDNIHGQCVNCNQYKAGNAVDYRARLIQRIGLGRVERLEADNRTHKWRKEELIGLKAYFRRKLRQLGNDP